MKTEDVKFFDDARDGMVDILCRLIEQDTTNLPGNEYLAAKVVHEFFDDCGIEYKDYEKQPGRTNVIATIGKGKPVLAAAAHMDVVPAGEGWSTEPFKPVVKDGRVYGRGTVDNKGQLASLLYCAKYLKEHEAELNGTFMIIAAADQERGSELGLVYLVEEGIVEADAAIIPDTAGNMREISVGEKGMVRMRVTSYGRQAHASTPEVGFNAIWPLVDFLTRFKKLDLGGEKHDLFSPLTTNLGLINGGAAVNIVPAQAEADIDCRYLPGMSGEEICGRLRKLAEETMAENSGSKIEVAMLENMAPFELSQNEPVITLIQKHAHEVLGLEPKLCGMAGTTVCKQLVAKGIPSVGYSTGDDGVAHVADEYIAIDELVDFAKVMYSIVMDFCG